MTELVPPLGVRVEFAFGAEPGGNSLLWNWTSLPIGEADSPLSSVQVNWGRPDESARVTPSSCDFRLDNTSGDFTPDNLLGQYYPNIARGTPVRVKYAPQSEPDTFTLIEDNFDRTVSAGWGRTSGQGRPWRDLMSPVWSSSVDGDEALVTMHSSTRLHMEQPCQFFNGDILVAISPKQLATENAFTAGVTYRNLGFYMVDVWFLLDDSMQVFFSNEFGFNAVTFAVLGTYSANDVFWLRVQVDDDTHRIRVWRDGDPEPGTWDLDVVDDGSSVVLPTAGGWLPGRVSLQASNSGAPDPIIGFNDLTVTGHVPPLFMGQVVVWAPEWPAGDLSDEAAGDPGYAVTSVTCAGALRRLGQGQSALQSALTRAVPTFDDVVAYWPMEDGETARRFASPIMGVSDMFAFDGDIRGASVEATGGSKPLPAFPVGSEFYGYVPDYVPADPSIGPAVDWLYRADEGPASSILRVWTAGSPVVEWRILTSATQLVVEAYAGDGSQIYSNGLPLHADFYGDWIRFRLQVFIDGANVRYILTAFRPDGSTPELLQSISDTVTTGTDVGQIVRVGSGADNDRSVGHVTVTRSSNTDPFQNNADDGYTDERAVDRVERLCLEEGIPLTIIRTDTHSERMGPQRPATLLDLLQECADLDSDILGESRWTPGLLLVPRSSMNNQTPRLVLDAGGAVREIAPPFRPILDDQRLRNDVTVSRADGSSAQLVDQVLIDTEGRYDEETTVNAAADFQLPALAGWRLHQGTWPGMRYPSLSPALNQAVELIPAWAGINPGDRVQIVNLPPQHPAGTVDLLIQGVSQSLTPTSWDAVANCSPAGPWTVGVIEGTGQDADLDIVDTDGSQLAFAIDDTTTTLSVTTSGKPWTTDVGGEGPFDIEIGGEAMTVTNVTGTIIQTLTATRGVNGVTKAHNVGADVRLAHPMIVSL